MALLVTLAAQAGKVFSREELMAAVWSRVVVSDETLSRCISDLRQALDDDPRSPRYIETLARRGYRLMERPGPLIDGRDRTSLPEIAATTPLDAGRRAGRFRQASPWLGMALALVLAVTGWLVIRSDTGDRLPMANPPPAENGLAVLPFINLSDEPELEYFSDGLSEELLHRLASIEALAVVARTSAFAFKGSNRDVREIGRELGVTYVLEGSVRRQDDRIRIGAQLIDVRSGFQLFSRVYERPFSDLFAIQEHVAMEVGAALEPRLAGLLAGLQSPPPETAPEALEAYLLGKHLQRKLSVDGLEGAIREFRRAIDIDPDFARAHAGLAETLALTSQYDELPIASVRAEIEGLIEKALELDPRCTMAWHARGLLAFYESRYSDALEAFTTERILDPNAIGAFGMQAWTLRSLGRNREALLSTTLALQKDPINAHTINVHAALLGQLGEFEQAERFLRRSMDIDPNYLNAFWGMGYLKWLTGRHAEAANWYEAGIDNGIRQSHAYVELGRVLLELGDYTSSLKWIEAGLDRTTDPVTQLDSLLAWHQYQGDFAGLAKTVGTYDERFVDHIGMPPYRALAALLNGDAETAIREYESLTGRDSKRLHSHWDMESGYWHALYLARARQLAGRARAADLTLAEAEKHLATFEDETGFPGIAAYYRAAIASLRHDSDRALRFLEEARAAGWRRHAQARYDPLLAGLHGDQRLDLLLGQVQSDLESERVALVP